MTPTLLQIKYEFGKQVPVSLKNAVLHSFEISDDPAMLDLITLRLSYMHMKTSELQYIQIGLSKGDLNGTYVPWKLIVQRTAKNAMWEMRRAIRAKTKEVVGSPSGD